MRIDTTYHYDPVTVPATRKGRCPTCGKPTTRRRTFSRTVSPYNRHPDGTPKSYAEVHRDVQALAQAWAPESEEFEHGDCRARRVAESQPVVTVTPYRRPESVTAMLVAERVALHTVAVTLIESDLAAVGVQIHHPWPDASRTRPLRVEIGASLRPAEFYRWVTRLPVEQVSASFEDYRTTLRVTVEFRGLEWSFTGELPRPPFGDRLPGLADDPADPVRNRAKRITGARLTVAQLGKVITALSLSTEIVEDPEIDGGA